MTMRMMEECGKSNLTMTSWEAVLLNGDDDNNNDFDENKDDNDCDNEDDAY